MDNQKKHGMVCAYCGNRTELVIDVSIDRVVVNCAHCDLQTTYQRVDVYEA